MAPLAPDVEVVVELGRARLDGYVDGAGTWTELLHLAEVDSTNSEVVRRVRAGGPLGMVVVADRQVAGRGRRQRQWVDVAGGNLSLSVATGDPGSHVTLVPMVAALAAAEALDRAGVAAQLKWPNDLLVTGGSRPPRKVGGILIEAHDLRPDGPAFLVIGIGINVDWRGHERTGPAARWTSVSEETAGDVDRWQLTHDLLRALAVWLAEVPGDPARLLAAYTGRCCTLGQRVRVSLPGGAKVEGTALAIGPAGGLVIDTERGRQVVMAGDVEHLRPA